MTRFGDEKKRSEYVGLRAELLSSHERAYGVWRWGLIAILGTLGASITTLIEIREDLCELSTTSIYGIAVVLYGFAAAIALTLTTLGANIQDHMYRVGGYLAVFHEQQSSKNRLAYNLGWHIWNRIEKLRDRFKKIPIDHSEMRGFTFHGDRRVYVLVLGFFVLCVSGLTSILTKAKFLCLALPGIIVCVVVWIWLRAIDQRGKKGIIQWNQRWVYLYE